MDGESQIQNDGESYKPKKKRGIKTYDDATLPSRRKLYFNGEADTSQTTYESMANHCQIATTARKAKVGRCLHTFLRQIIDKRRLGFFISHLMLAHDDNMPMRTIDGKKTRGFTLDEIISGLAEQNHVYGQVHDIVVDGIYVNCELGGGQVIIKRFIGDVDVWDVYRIASELEIWTGYERYKHIKL